MRPVNLAMIVVALAAETAAAQIAVPNTRMERRVPPPELPSEFQPPAGMCRLWVNGFRPDQQPAPTDCATVRAEANKLANSVVIEGPPAPQTTGRSDPGRPQTRVLDDGDPKDRLEGRGRTAKGPALKPSSMSRGRRPDR
jgi:hypothetical protein